MPRDPATPAHVDTARGDQVEFVTEAEMREQEKANMIAALRHANWQVWGSSGAAELLGVKPSTLTYRMKVLSLRKQA